MSNSIDTDRGTDTAKWTPFIVDTVLQKESADRSPEEAVKQYLQTSSCARIIIIIIIYLLTYLFI